MTAIPWFAQAARTFSSSRYGCHSIWLVTIGSEDSFTACSTSFTVKFEMPMWRVYPSFFIFAMAPIVSASGISGLGQWISNRLTSETRRFARLCLTARSRLRGASSVCGTLVVMKMSSRFTPDACSPSPTSFSLP